jgi:hypothetical protein
VWAYEEEDDTGTTSDETVSKTPFLAGFAPQILDNENLEIVTEIIGAGLAGIAKEQKTVWASKTIQYRWTAGRNRQAPATE